MLVACEALYGSERAEELRVFLEEVTGEPCPVWPRDAAELPPVPVPR